MIIFVFEDDSLDAWYELWLVFCMIIRVYNNRILDILPWNFTLYFDVWIHCWHQSFFTICTYKLDLTIIGNLKTIKIYFVMSRMFHLNVLSLEYVIFLVHYSLSPFSIPTLMFIAFFYLIWRNILALGVFIISR
jgi:hypothetical protein